MISDDAVRVSLCQALDAMGLRYYEDGLEIIADFVNIRITVNLANTVCQIIGTWRGLFVAHRDVITAMALVNDISQGDYLLGGGLLHTDDTYQIALKYAFSVDPDIYPGQCELSLRYAFSAMMSSVRQIESVFAHLIDWDTQEDQS